MNFRAKNLDFHFKSWKFFDDFPCEIRNYFFDNFKFKIGVKLDSKNQIHNFFLKLIFRTKNGCLQQCVITSRDDQSYFAFVDTPTWIPYPRTSGASRPDFLLWTAKFRLPDNRVLYVDRRKILSYRKGFVPGLGLPSDFQSIDHSSWIHRQNRWLAPHADAPATYSTSVIASSLRKSRNLNSRSLQNKASLAFLSQFRIFFLFPF